MGLFSRKTAVDGWTVTSISREHTQILKGSARIYIAMETMAEGKTFQIYPDDIQIITPDPALTTDGDIDIAARGLR